MTTNLITLSSKIRAKASSLPRRQLYDALAGKAFSWMAFLPLAIAIAVLIALMARSRPMLETRSLWDLLAGQTWKPLQGEFGFFPFIIGTVWVTTVAMVLAIPPCLLTAIYLAEYAQPAVRTVTKPLIDLLAAIPSVVYGVWGVIVIVPWVEDAIAPFFGKWLGSVIPLFAVNNPTGFGILAGGIVLAVMVAPFIIAVTYEVMHTVPEGMREASLAVGATRWQTIKYAVLPRARAGIIAGVVLGSSRALGETMAVLMVVGNVVKVPTSIFDTAYPLPALIANNYGEMLSIPLYDAALLGAALILLLIVLVFNIMATVALRTVIGRTPR
jgi:phosphate transport system permease protein